MSYLGYFASCGHFVSFFVSDIFQEKPREPPDGLGPMPGEEAVHDRILQFHLGFLSVFGPTGNARRLTV